jgi:hypothetical protein
MDGSVGTRAAHMTSAGVTRTVKDVMKIISLVAAMAVVLALATTASAAEQASQDGYLNQAGQVQGSVNSGSGGSGGGSLPFTGFDMALLAGAGGLLAAAGFGMRRLTRMPDSA